MIATKQRTKNRLTGRLAPIAYKEEEFPALRLARASRFVRIVARALLVLLIVAIVAMLFAPWQQTITGSGQVVAFAPLDRQQLIEAPIKGRIVEWGLDADGQPIRENSRVTKGEMILKIQDIDPNLLTRLENQLAASERQLAAQEEIVSAYTQQVEAFNEVRRETVAAADEYVKMAERKVEAERKNLEAAQASRTQAEADYLRQKQLFDEGLASELKMQLAERKFREAKAKQEQASAYVSAALNELEAKKRERGAKEREAQTKIDSANAMLRKAEGDTEKLQKDLLDAQSKLSRQQSQEVTAPRDGFIQRLVANQGGEIVKEGDPLFMLVPDTDRLAVQIWVDGNDAPLIDPGRPVRLQFEGWPAVQFSGWPSVAVGTFGGEVALVDPTDDGKGRFRVLIVPDEDEQSWPEYPYLRQGVRTNGWVLLDQVSLGYEVWRRMNGFPPALQSREKGKLPKPPLPK